MSLDFHVKCSDAFQQLADAHNEEIEKRAPAKVKYGEKDFDGLKYERKSGSKGDYEQASKEANENSEVFRALQKILVDKGGFWQSSTHKYWIHSGNVDLIDRRRKDRDSNPHTRMDESLANIRRAGETLAPSTQHK